MTTARQDSGFPSRRNCIHAAALLGLDVLLMLALLVPQVAAQNFKVLHAFGGHKDGSSPNGGVILDKAGNLYGVASFGGGKGAGGVIYEIGAAGEYTILHSFTWHEGCSSFASLLLDSAGNLYGTNDECGRDNLGTALEYENSGTLLVLHEFGDGLGTHPSTALVADNAGNLYGTTTFGGRADNGVVFEINPHTGGYKVLHEFRLPPDGMFPEGTLLRDSQGNLFGTTASGGQSECGTVFKLAPGNRYQQIHSFSRGEDGCSPVGALVWDDEGNLYSTTYQGGAYGFGTVFKLDRQGNLTVLYAFGASSPDGAHPNGGLVRDSAGNLYGTTRDGGAFGDGSVYELDANGQLTILHSFTWGDDGAFPFAGVTLSPTGKIYGTAFEGGYYNFGGVFEIDP